MSHFTLYTRHLDTFLSFFIYRACIYIELVPRSWAAAGAGCNYTSHTHTSHSCEETDKPSTSETQENQHFGIHTQSKSKYFSRVKTNKEEATQTKLKQIHI